MAIVKRAKKTTPPPYQCFFRNYHCKTWILGLYALQKLMKKKYGLDIIQQDYPASQGWGKIFIKTD